MFPSVSSTALAAKPPSLDHVHAAALPFAGLVEAGRVRVHVARVLPLADAAKAHELSETGRVRGKIVLTV
ncbi:MULTISPECIES: zinc-binding dehydrogenase [Amycolatopsis]|uniref:Zinc-binding dehydrogenase n=2 Tax=Amycolatopsis TaxID=1813 RepID=A0A1I3NRH1_9PSEU|nr:Zinc-binding dehydrogenase [Amycolatopsis sacchari]